MNSDKDLEQMLNANLYVDRFVNFEKTKMNLSNVERQLEAERYNKLQSYIAELDTLLQKEQITIDEILHEVLGDQHNGQDDASQTLVPVARIHHAFMEKFPTFARSKLAIVIRSWDKDKNGFMNRAEITVVVGDPHKPKCLQQAPQKKPVNTGDSVKKFVGKLQLRNLSKSQCFELFDNNKDYQLNMVDVKIGMR